jgi:hypothetical protein
MDKNHPLVRHFIALVESWNNPGYGEYLCWETLEGKRDRPFKYMDPLPEADMEVLRRLRDELKVWPFYDAEIDQWDVVSIEAWKSFTAKTTSVDIRWAMDL